MKARKGIEMRCKRFLPVVLVIIASGCAGNEWSKRIDDYICMIPPEKVAHYERDVLWSSPDGYDLHLDVSWPDGEGPFPVLIWIHGGSWQKFSKDANEGLARYITNRGYTVFNIDYRMSPDVSMKTIIEDAMGAVIWAKDHAEEYNGDPSRVAVAGHSAGGHLAAMVLVASEETFFSPTYKSNAGNDSSVKCGIPVSGVFDISKKAMEPVNDLSELWPKVMGVSYDKDPELYRMCSPVNYVRADLPPQLVIYAEDDFLRKDAEEWIKILEDSGATFDQYMQPDREHLWPTWHWQKAAKQTYDIMIEFLDENL